MGNGKNKYSTETKQAFKKMQEQKLIDSSLPIIKAFNRINEIVTAVEEKIHLERLFFEVCLELNKERGKRK
ncbi:UNVERIFIED_ORG: 2-C-methyl-D-erythritol 4-phosphate cytidylyltransferase [Peribacillus simplex]